MLESIYNVGNYVEFTYHGKLRQGTVDKLENGPNGPFVTLKLADGSGFRNFSVVQIERDALELIGKAYDHLSQ